MSRRAYRMRQVSKLTHGSEMVFMRESTDTWALCAGVEPRASRRSKPIMISARHPAGYIKQRLATDTGRGIMNPL